MLNNKNIKHLLADSGWKELTLNSGYTGNVYYRKKNGEVEVQATASRSSTSGLGNVATLPSGYCPVRTVYDNGYGGAYTIYANGVIQIGGGVANAYFIKRFYTD